MPKIPPHFIVEKENKVFFLIKGVFPKNLILENYMSYFPKTFKGIVMRCEESFYKMRIKVNSKKMTRRSKYTTEYKRGKSKNPIPFPHIVIFEKKEVYFKIDSGWPASLSVKPIMREHFPDDFTGIIASVKTWQKLMRELDPENKNN